MNRSAWTGSWLCLLLVACHTRTAPAEEPRYSAAALYNLANSHARAGKPGLAVLNYERAALLAPDDPDIEANLRYVRLSAHLPSGTDTSQFIARVFTMVNPIVTGWLGLAGIVLVGMSVLAGRTFPRFRWTRRGVGALGIALVGLTVGQGVVLWPALHAAVVVTADAPVRVSPAPMGDPVFSLKEGETVKMTAEHEDFVLIQSVAGKSGWVARANIVPVVPNHN